MGVIEVQRLEKIYGRAGSPRSVHALRGIGLEVRAGEVFGLLGPNGAGKTTLVKVLLGLVRKTAGDAVLLGRSVTDPRARRRVGYLPEGHSFPPYLDARQMLDFMGALSSVEPGVRRARTEPLLRRVGMLEWARVKCGRYSKGMLQRAGLAAALINDPEVVFLDEPTDGVDPLGRKGIRDLIFDLKREGKTIFLNSHLLSEVDQVADRIAILNRGTVVHVGTPKELKEGGLGGKAAVRYRIEVLGDAAEAAAAVGSAATIVSAGDSALTVEVLERSDINGVIDALRRAQVSLAAVVPETKSLEDRFIELVTRPEEPEAPPA